MYKKIGKSWQNNAGQKAGVLSSGFSYDSLKQVV